MSTLVLGATGRLGPHIVRALVEAGEPVTALVRDRGKAERVLPQEARVAIGDFAAGGGLDTLLLDVDNLVILTPHGPDMATTQRAVVEAANRHHVRAVKISGTGPLISADGPDACRQHWEVEQALLDGSHRHVVLRPNAFMQGLVAGAVAEAQATGGVSDPIDGAAINAVDCRDIGAVVAGVIGSTRYDGAVLSVTGPRSVTYEDLAMVLTRLGIPASSRAGSPRQSGDRLRSLGLSDWEATHLEEMLIRFAAGAADFTTPTVYDVTGKQPRSIEALIGELTQAPSAV